MSLGASRRAVGLVLGIVGLLIGILLLLTITRAFLSETVLDDAAAEQVGATALTLAESALEEMQLEVRAGVNDAKSPLHALFRKRLQRDPDDGFELPLRTAPNAARLAAQAPYAQAGVSMAVEAPRVTYRKLFTLARFNYDEHFGTISYRVHAFSTNARPRVERWLSATQEYKVVAASIPPPFDQVCLFMVNAEPIAGGSETNRAMELFAGVRQNWMAQLDTLIQNAPGAAQEIGAIRRQFEKIPPLEQRGETASGGSRPVHLIPPDLTAFVDPSFSKTTPEVPCGAIDLATLVPAWRREVEQLDRRATEQVNALVQAGQELKQSKKAPDRAVIEGAVSAMKTVAARTLTYQDAIRQWQDMMGEHTGQSRKDLLTNLEQLAPEVLERKAFFTVREADGDVNAALQALRDRLLANTGTDTLNGIVRVENPRTVLDLTRLAPVKGRVVFAVSGAVRVGGLARATPADLVAVVSRGPMTLAGDVTGALAAMGGLKVEGAPRVTGAVVVDAPAPGTLTNLTVVSDPTLAIGRPKPGGGFVYDNRFFHVGVAPVLASRAVSRTRPAK